MGRALLYDRSAAGLYHFWGCTGFSSGSRSLECILRQLAQTRDARRVPPRLLHRRHCRVDRSEELRTGQTQAWSDYGQSLQINSSPCLVPCNHQDRDHGATKKRVPAMFSLQTGNVQLETKLATKYLGVLIDGKLSFGR